MDVLIVGSLAYDSIASPLGAVENALGGSATYAGLSCAFHRNRLGLDSVGLVGVVGSDFRQKDREILENAHLDTKGIETVERDNVSRDSSADDGFREEVSARVGQSRRFERVAEVRGGTIARGFGENSERKTS